MKIFLAYGAALITLVALDAVWVGFLTKDFAKAKIGHLFGTSVIWWAVIAFYVLYAAAVVYFAALPGTSVSQVLLRGAFLGFTAYMTYDLVNLATLKDWPLSFAAVDMTWGTVMTAFASLAAFLVIS